MSIKILSNFKKWVNDEEGEHGLEEMGVEFPEGEVKMSRKVAPVTGSQMSLFEPRSYDEALEIARRLYEEHSVVVVNLSKLDSNDAQRTIDFLHGCVVALRGEVHRIDVSVFIFTPQNVPVDNRLVEN